MKMAPKATSSSSSKQGDLYQMMHEFVKSRTPDQSVTHRYLHEVMRQTVASISQEIGWNSAHQSAIDVLVDLTVRYLLQVAKQSKKYTEHYGRTLVNEDDVALGFKDMNISISELEEYLQNFEPINMPREVPYFPVPRRTDLNFLRPGSAEVLTRPVHVHEYMPPMILESEENKDEGEDGEERRLEQGLAELVQIKQEPEGQNAIQERENVLDPGMNGIPMENGMMVLEEPSQVPEVGSELIVAEPIAAEVEIKTESTPPPPVVVNNEMEESSDDDIEPSSSKTASIFANFKSSKKLKSRSENAVLKRLRKMIEEEGHPVREVTSVIMTTSGFLSESREGKLPDTRPPPQRHFFDSSPPPPEKRKKIPTMKKILEGVKKLDHRHSDDEGEEEGPGLFDVMDKIKTASGGSHAVGEPSAASHPSDENGEMLKEPRPSKKLSKQERRLLKEKKELKGIKKLKLKSKDKSLSRLKKSSSKSIDLAKEHLQASASSKDKNKLLIFTKKSSSSIEKQQRRKEKKLKMKQLKMAAAATPLESDPVIPRKISTDAGITEPIESDEDFSHIDNAGSQADKVVPPVHIVANLSNQESSLKKKYKKDKLKSSNIFELKQKKIKEKGLVISPTVLPPIPKLTKAKLGKLSKRPLFPGLPPHQDVDESGIPLKKKRGRPKKIWDGSNQGPHMPLPAAQLASIGKSLMIKEPSLKLEPPLKIMKIRKEHMEPVQDLPPPSQFPPLTTKPPTISPKQPVVSADLLKRLPAQPGLIPDVSPAPPIRLPKELPSSISITPAALSPAKEVTSSARNFGGGLPPNVCSSVTITRIDMSQQHKLPSAYDDTLTPGIGPPPQLIAAEKQRSKLSKSSSVPPPPPLQIPMQTETESGITITPIVMGNNKLDRYDIPPPPPLQERPQRAGAEQKASMLAKLDEELSSTSSCKDKEHRKKDKEKRKELSKEKKKKKKDKDKDKKDKSEKKKKKKEKLGAGVSEQASSSSTAVSSEPPVATVPKLTLKLSGHSNASTPVDSPNPPQVFIGSDHDQGPPKKITFKPMEEKRARTPSPDLHVARFSPLVTRPQKPARAAKAHAAAAVAAVSMGASVNHQDIVSFPPVGRVSESRGGGGGNRRGRGRPSKGGEIPTAIPTPIPPTSSSVPSTSKAAKSSVTVLETETVGCIIDEQGNKIWICPACGRQDDGSPMIGCDICDDWYHFTCVGITEDPAEDEQWYCKRCLRKQKPEGKQKKKK